MKLPTKEKMERFILALCWMVAAFWCPKWANRKIEEEQAKALIKRMLARIDIKGSSDA